MRCAISAIRPPTTRFHAAARRCAAAGAGAGRRRPRAADGNLGHQRDARALSARRRRAAAPAARHDRSRGADILVLGPARGPALRAARTGADEGRPAARGGYRLCLAARRLDHRCDTVVRLDGQPHRWRWQRQRAAAAGCSAIVGRAATRRTQPARQPRDRMAAGQTLDRSRCARPRDDLRKLFGSMGRTDVPASCASSPATTICAKE